MIAPRPKFGSELLEDAPCGVAVSDPEGRILYLNTTLKRWTGHENWTPDASEFQSMSGLFAGAGGIFYDAQVLPMIQLQGFVREIACDLLCNDTDTIPVLLSGIARTDDSGAICRHDYTLFDARERRLYERELQRRRAEADELAAIIRSSPNAIFRVAADGRVKSMNRGAALQSGHDAETAIGLPVSEVYPLKNEGNWFETYADPAREFTFEGESNSGRFFEITICPISDTENYSADYSVILRDVTTRKLAEQQTEIAVAEMRHRVKNTLGVVAGIARQSLPREHAMAFVPRLQALARAHDDLMRGPGIGLSLFEMLDATMVEAGGNSRVRIEGQDIGLGSRQATALNMVFHELVTNALKYGALSEPAGSVTLTCTTGEDGFTKITWVERDGPKVTEPKRTGFGTRMMRAMLSPDFTRHYSLNFASDGLCVEMEISPGEEPEANVH